MTDCVVTVFEYDYLTPVEAEDCTRISRDAFDYLEKLCLAQNENYSRFLRLCSRGGQKALQVLNYVGVVHTPSGQQIEVLPKVFGTSNQVSEARAALLNMLRHLWSFRHIETTNASVAIRHMPLLEVFIRQFLQSVNHLVKRGLRSEYVRREDNQAFMKGKLMPSRQLQHNLLQQHRFYVEYDEYLQDRPVNRLIHSALIKVASLTQSNASQKLCRELSFAFNDVPPSRDVKQDFTTMRLDRGMDHYRQPLDWARLILEGFSPLASHGRVQAMSLLFPMEAVFEAYVGSVLRRQLKAPLWLKEQAASEYLVKYESKSWFQLKPDLLVMRGKRIALVLDTKWKRLDITKNNGKDKFGLSQADMYQMFAYGHKYLNGEGELVLIYPKTEHFSEPLQHSFEFSSLLRLWVIPFDIAEGVEDSERLMLPDLG